MSRRIDVKAILDGPVLRRKLMIACLIATQAREGIETTYEQAAAAYDKVTSKGDRGTPENWENANKKKLTPF